MIGYLKNLKPEEQNDPAPNKVIVRRVIQGFVKTSDDVIYVEHEVEAIEADSRMYSGNPW